MRGERRRQGLLRLSWLRLSWLSAVALVAVALSSCTVSGPAVGPPTSGTSTSTGPGPTTSSTAVAGSPLGAKWDWGRFQDYAPYLQSLRGSVTYYEMVWCDVEPSKGQLDWARVDQVAERTRSLGITLLLKIRVGRCWATGGEAQFTRGNAGKTESAMPTDLDAYADFVKSTVTRYAPLGVTEFAIENEINSPSFWDGTAGDYRTLVTKAAAAIRSAGPQAKVVDAGLASSTYGYGIADALLRQGNDAEAIKAYDDYFAERFGTRGNKLPRVTSAAELRAVLASAQGVRNLALLQLMQQLAQEKVVDIRQIHYYERWTSIPALLTYMRATTPASTPIEAWEVGSFAKGSSADDQVRSQEMVKSVGLLLGGGVRNAIWLPLAVDPTGRNADEPRYGLLDPGGAPRRSGTMMQAMVAASRDAAVVAVDSGGLRGVAFQKAGGSSLFVWGAGTTVTLKLAPGEGAAPVGDAVPTTTEAGSFAVSDAPQQVNVASSVASFMDGQG